MASGSAEYVVMLGERGGGRPLRRIPFSSLSWQRTLNETSTATIRLAGRSAAHDAAIAGVQPWEHEITIYRDGAAVWVGPVRTPNEGIGGHTIECRDLSTWFDWRRIRGGGDHVGADLALIYAAYAEEAIRVDDSMNVTVQAAPCGVIGDRHVNGDDRAIAADRMRELSRTAVNWTMTGRTLIVGGVTLAPRLPPIVDGHVVTGQVRRDGQFAASDVVVRGATNDDGSIVYGFANRRSPRTGVLDYVTSEFTILDETSANAAAKARLDLWADVAVFPTVEVVADRPVPVDALVPGAVGRLALSLFPTLLDADFRLRRVEVSADRPGETVTLTFVPPVDVAP